MDPNLLKQAIEDAKVVRQTTLNNAMNALNQSFNNHYSGSWTVLTASYASGACYVSNHISGFPNAVGQDNGVIRYNYYNDAEEESILDHIEKEGLVILDQSDDDSKEKPCWYEAINPDDLKKNVDGINELPMLTDEICDEIISDLDKMEVQPQVKRNVTFKELVRKLIETCKKELL